MLVRLSDACEIPYKHQNTFIYTVGFAADWYWSSTENDNNNAWKQNFNNGNQNNNNKNNNNNVRAVRGFEQNKKCRCRTVVRQRFFK